MNAILTIPRKLTARFSSRVRISLTVEFHGPRLTVLIRFAGDDGTDAAVEQILVDPVGTISFVAGDRDWIQGGVQLVASDIGILQQVRQEDRFVGLSW